MQKMLMMIAVAFALGLTGCRSSSPALPPEVMLPEAFSGSGSQVLPEKWWESLHDAALNDLMDEAMAGNLTVQMAWDRLSQAEQVAKKAGASLWPAVTYQGSATRTRTEVGNTTTYATSLSAGLVATYEIDLWGRVRSVQQAALADVASSQEDLAAAAVTLSASVAKTWFQLVEAQQQVVLIGRQVDRNQKVLEIITTQFRKGQAVAADVFRQRQLVESTRGTLVQAEEQAKLLQHSLCVLLGRVPQQAWNDLEQDLIALPSLPDTGVPLKMIERRPDVVSAFHAIEAADHRTAAAITAKYPTLSLTGTLTTSESRIEDLFDDWLASLAAGVAGPLFDAHLLEAEAQRTRAVLSQAIHAYRQVVLESIQDVEDALVQEGHQRVYVESLATQLDLSRKAFERTRQQYLNGQVDYLRVLESLATQQQLERSELTAQRQLIERRIDLCRALAGSWDMERPELAQVMR